MYGKALRVLREFHYLKQIDVSRAMGMSSATICRVETDKFTPSIDMLDRFARFYDIPVSSIILIAEALDSDDATSMRKIVCGKVIRLLEWLESIKTKSGEDITPDSFTRQSPQAGWNK